MPTVFNSVMPSVAVRDMEASIRFYREQLGFECIFTNGEPTAFALLKRDGVEIGLCAPVLGGQPGKNNCYIKLNGIDLYYAEIQAKGVPVRHPLRVEEYGMKEFMIEDPDGNTVNFGEVVGLQD